MGQSLEGFLQWKALVNLLFGCIEAVSIDLATCFPLICWTILWDWICSHRPNVVSELERCRHRGSFCAACHLMLSLLWFKERCRRWCDDSFQCQKYDLIIWYNWKQCPEIHKIVIVFLELRTSFSKTCVEC